MLRDVKENCMCDVAQGIYDRARARQQLDEKLGAATRDPEPNPPMCARDGDQGTCGKAVQEPLIYRLRRDACGLGEQAARQRRAVEILERHPEFEEFIELLKLIPLY
jgi:hypothetical protein